MESDHTGISSDKEKAKSSRRKPKVSEVRFVRSGVSRELTRGRRRMWMHIQLIFRNYLFRYYDGGTQEANQAHDWTCGLRLVGRSARQISGSILCRLTHHEYPRFAQDFAPQQTS